MTSIFKNISEANLETVTDYVYSLVNKQYKTIILEAEVGCGKTTLINFFLLKYYNIKSKGSPTFNIINQYKINDITINHIDLYRIKSFDDYILEEIDNGDLNFIEWPYKIQNELDKYVIIKISNSDQDTRNYEVIY